MTSNKWLLLVFKMPEIFKIVVQEKVYYECDKYGEDLMYQTGSVFRCYPDQYEYKCENCGHKALLEKIYPYIKDIVRRGD